MKKSTILNSISLVIGFIVMVYGVDLAWQTHMFVETSVHTEAEVVRNITTEATDGSYRYTPVLRFETRTGDFIEFTSRLKTKGLDYRKGELLPIYYNPYNTKQAVVDTTDSNAWYLGIGIAVIGALIFLWSVIMLLFKPKK